MDYVYHIHSDGSSYRALKVKQTMDGLRVSLPGVEFEETDPHTLSIKGITANTMDTPDLRLYPVTEARKNKSFQTIEDTEHVKAVIESHPSGISRKNIAKELRMPANRVGKIVREILATDSNYREVKEGKEMVIRTDPTPDWWKFLKDEIE